MAIPPGVVTLILPLHLFRNRFNSAIRINGEGINAAVPPKLTAVEPVKSAPTIFTVFPCGAVGGLKEVMVGAAKKVKLAVESTEPARLAMSFACSSSPDYRRDLGAVGNDCKA